MDNGSGFFNASKPARQETFGVANDGAPGAVSAVLDTSEGTDKNIASHIQPAPRLRSNGGGLPGEQEDPRFC